jgi:hypothetical protein
MRRNGTRYRQNDRMILRHLKCCRLTPRWSGRVEDKVPSPNTGARAAQLNR